MKREVLFTLPEVYDAGGDLSKSWLIIFSVPNPQTGAMERVRKAKGINKFHTLKERYAAANKMKKYWLEKLQSGYNPFIDSNKIYSDNLQFQTAISKYYHAKSKNGTFTFYASKYLDKISTEVDPEGTLPTYRSKFRMFAAWLISSNMADHDVSVITQPVMEQFFNHLIKEKELSKNSVMKYEQLLFKVFEYIRKERKTAFNPVIDMPRTNRINDQTPRPISKKQMKLLKKVLKNRDPQLLLASEFEYYCSIRPGNEMRNLRIGDIDLYRGTIDVSRIRAKTRKARTITIPNVFLEKLEKINIDAFDVNFYVFSRNQQPGPVKLGKNNMRQRFRKIREELGLPWLIKFYSMKHTGNIDARNAGISTEAIQDQNGHASIKTTEVYLNNRSPKKHKEVLHWPKM